MNTIYSFIYSEKNGRKVSKNKWSTLDNDIYQSKTVSNTHYYLLAELYIIKGKQKIDKCKVTLVTKDELFDFMREWINPETFDGIDMMAIPTTEIFNYAIGCRR